MSNALDIYNDMPSLGAAAIDAADDSMKQRRLRTPKDFAPNSTTRLRAVPPTPANIDLARQAGHDVEIFYEYHRHMYEIGGKGSENWAIFACPHKNLPRYGGKQRCVDCEKGRKLRTSNKRDTGPWKHGMELGAQHLRVFLVIDRDAPELGVHPLGISAPIGKWKGRSMYEQLTAELKDEHTGGDYLHPVHGRDIFCKKVVTSKDAEGTSYKWSLAAQPSPLHPDPATMLELIQSQPSIPQMIAEEVAAGIVRHAEIHNLGGDGVQLAPAPRRDALPSARPDVGSDQDANDDIYDGVGGDTDVVEF